eukprot:TRINITY_DN1807_c0_g2_i2.p1 TRINITY_DN1807_c0_g2~~TRINITY_DN1807_c0_g2_i2.p1  ORF type:complete len:219 (+),score=53.26 TRINITY_DN1807_c0_g2_i2:61-717(+)
MSRRVCALGFAVAGALALAGLQSVFVAQRGTVGAPGRSLGHTAGTPLPPAVEEVPPSNTFSAFRLAAGALLSFVLLAAARPALADVEDVVIAVDEKGKTTSLTKEGVIRGKRLFNAACAQCHVGGGTRTNQNVGLSTEELSGAVPNRNTVEGLIDYLNSPTSYDGLKDISEVHPSVKAADVWPKMRSMKQQDLYDMSAYILYMNQTIPEKWGGGKQYY